MNNKTTRILAWIIVLLHITGHNDLFAGRSRYERRKARRLARRNHKQQPQKRTRIPAQIPHNTINTNIAVEKTPIPQAPPIPTLESAVYTPTQEDKKTVELTIGTVHNTPVPNNDLGDDETIEFHFEDADLEQLVTQIEALFNVKFIRDDSIDPILKGAKKVKGHKISFKTQDPLSKKQAWDLFLTFLDIAGLTAIPHSQEGFYRITTIPTARKSAIPAYIGTHFEELPDNDQVIRYMYFIQNTTVETIKTIIESLRSNTSSLIILQGIKSFIITDKAYNIRHLMNIITELDKVTMPQSMSVLKLKRADAQEVKKLYETLIQTDNRNITSRILAARKKPTSLYFPESIKIIAESRTNSLILLGSQQEIKRIEEFIIKHVDVDLDVPYSPLHVYKLQYANAKTVADIMNQVTKFGSSTAAGKSGGVRGKDKYLKPMSFTAEPETNRLVIKGEYDDYLRAIEVVKKLDEQQPQVAVEILILAVQLKNNKELGAQIRTRENDGQSTMTNVGGGLFGKNIKFQTSGLFRGSNAAGIVENPDGAGVQRVLGDLISLASGAGAGNTILTLGKDVVNGMQGVWGIVQALDTVSNTQVLSNPFVVATNKTKALVSLGETRRVVTSTIVTDNPVNTFGDYNADLIVALTPQINSDGMIILDIDIKLDSFIGAADANNVAKNTRNIKTKTIVADKEVLALGGLIQNRSENNASKTPLLGDVPVLGWLFKNKRKTTDKNNLLILLSPRIIRHDQEGMVQDFTKEKVDEYHGMMDSISNAAQKKDPIHSMFFADKGTTSEELAEDFLHGHKKNKPKRLTATQKRRERRRGKRRRLKNVQHTPHKVAHAATDTIPDQHPLTHDPATEENVQDMKSRYNPGNKTESVVHATQSPKKRTTLQRIRKKSLMDFFDSSDEQEAHA